MNDPKNPSRGHEASPWELAWADLDNSRSSGDHPPEPVDSAEQLKAFADEMAAAYQVEQDAEAERHDAAREALEREDERYPSPLDEER